ncbi:MAG: UDP-N-acetylmuramoyl-tripeptide--D-alanyl-D-alanine ligase [Rhodospirillales bacterium]|nr:UDP-N-acetylmuramoyl-tripeptide--D-alanyl-D-alanine ligase [Rhodospirillales bacterium]
MTTPLWTAREAAEATGGVQQGDWTATGVSIDSRTVAPGDLFVALAGPSFDGHDFVGAALAKGAVAALVHRRPEGLPETAPLLMVKDSLEGLTALGRAARTRTTSCCFGITGSVGKTSSKEMLRAALSGAGQTYASTASFNNHWGVPLSLARMPLKADYGVFEMGMNHPGEIRALVDLVRPKVALVTQIAPAHLAYFPEGLDGIAKAKAEIFEGLEHGGTAVINADAPRSALLREMAETLGAKVVRFGRSTEAEYRLLELSVMGDASLVRVALPSGDFSFSLGLPGRHMVLNALGVLAAALAVGLSPETTAMGLAGLDPMKGRGKRQTIALPGGGAFILIDEGYNANPTSVGVALELLRTTAPRGQGRRLAVLGDMLELGDRSAELHAGLATAVEAAGCEQLFSCGAEMLALQEALPQQLRTAHRATSAELAPLVVAEIRSGDVVLVKGSLGTRMAVIVSALETLEPTKINRHPA